MFSIALKPVQDQIAELTARVDGPIDALSFEQKSLLFSELAILAYLDEDHASTWAKKMGFLDAKKIKSASGEFLSTVIIGDHDVVLALRGTSDFIDVKTDFNLDLVKDGDLPGRVHDGFRQAASLVWPSVAPLIETGENIWLTGHSMGGSIAAIMAVRAERSSGPSICGLVTFGMPRVGDHTYTKSLRLLHDRWVHHHDVVPRVPTKWMGYSHFGIEQYISNGANVPKTIWYRLKRFLSRLFDRLALDGAADHNIVEYRAAIARTQQERPNG